ncbi:MAG: PEP-CTERM sorting domain-containing protein [Akkermansiaceae bacterium]|jgi:hypothetical protein|nr:PEP-CTERM sorting domain-containing protein [Akkermansiaceae bacterium]MDP4646310.1 PEP-CTERM sorting domain-containing protein [Akkermansiaceae bacterium]MDP4721456.1 PEP-CTERM sorting domain-containing protein [Akkermansiaceae bacterium]MDP4779849.1 PEP-CTERM sorting domain-containing protein [Akkermansiaceae bacterium]MDP4845816.1 PEP-CTERM sorting domain-containing protein [Akkermansiaceae bacterium]
MKSFKKNATFAAFAVLSSVPSDAATISYSSNVAGSDYAVGTNWNGGSIPGTTPGDGGLINANKSTTVSSVITTNPASLQIQNALGTATINVTTGGSLTTSSTNVGHNRTGTVADGIGVLNITGGTYSGGTVIVGNAGIAEGIINVSGAGTFNFGTMTVDRIAGTKGTINVTGSSASINGTSMTLNDNAFLNFTLGSAGVASISLSNAFTLNALANLSIDASLYAGGVGIIDLVTFATNTGTTWNSVAINNLDPAYAGVVKFDTDSMYLEISPIPEPSAFVLLGLSVMGFTATRRRR